MTETTRNPSTAPRRSAAGAFARAALMLGAATLLAVAGTAAVAAFVLRADFLTGAAELVNRVAFAHGAVAAALAASPLVAVLLVGYAYMQRGIRKRAAAKAAGAAR
jgi:hypothetical protein